MQLGIGIAGYAEDISRNWVEVQPILHVVFRSELKMGEAAGTDPGGGMLGRGPGAFGMKHVV